MNRLLVLPLALVILGAACGIDSTATSSTTTTSTFTSTTASSTGQPTQQTLEAAHATLATVTVTSGVNGEFPVPGDTTHTYQTCEVHVDYLKGPVLPEFVDVVCAVTPPLAGANVTQTPTPVSTTRTVGLVHHTDADAYAAIPVNITSSTQTQSRASIESVPTTPVIDLNSYKG